MNRAILSIFLAALVLLLLSSHDTFASRRHNVPATPPREIAHSGGVFRADSVGGGVKKMSVTFWSSDNAASRLENMQQAALARADSSMVHIGVNLDDTPDLFADFLMRDNLRDDPNQLLATDEAARSLSDTYGYGTMYY